MCLAILGSAKTALKFNLNKLTHIQSAYTIQCMGQGMTVVKVHTKIMYFGLPCYYSVFTMRSDSNEA